MRVYSAALQIRLGPDDEERAAVRERIKPFEIQVSPIHDIECSRLDRKKVEGLDLVEFAVGNVDEGRDIATQIQQGMQLYRSLGLSEVGPWEHGEAQIDGRCIQGVDCAVEFQREVVAEVKLPGNLDQRLCKVGINTPVADLVRVGQRIAGNGTANSHVVQLVLLGTQAGFDIPETFAVSQLCECHAEVMVETGKLLDLEVAVVLIYASMKHMERKMLHYLREDELAGVHGPTLRTVLYEVDRTSGTFSSR